jgi:hypothetical protein
MARLGDRLWPRAVVAVMAGTVTERELAVLVVAGEQFGLPMDAVAEVAQRAGAPRSGPASAAALGRRVAGRLELARLARRERTSAGVWLVPTPAGLREAGLEYERWRPAGWKLEHHGAVVRLRLVLEREHPGARWESERAIRARLRGERQRRADGGLWWPDGGATGVELELHVKARRAPGVLSGPDRYVDIVTATDPSWREVWWFTPARHVERLQKRLTEAGGGDRHQAYPLPDGVAR